MEWRVIKIGAQMFDMLHAYGVGIVVACATKEPVVIEDEGYSYLLSSPCMTIPHTSIDLFDEVFRLPRPEEVLGLEQAQTQATRPPTPLAVANLDGLLAALFTRPDGAHCCSLSALLHKYRFDSSVIERGIASVRGICTKWKTMTAQEVPSASHWLDELLKDYNALRPCQPLPVTSSHDAGITAALTLDPSLGYAARQPLSDGQVAKKVNLTIRGTRFASLLAYIGAMRFLRAQPVAGSFIAYSVPVASMLDLSVESARSLLWARDDDEPEQALVLQALDLVTRDSEAKGTWKALSYQVLQTMAKQQAISRLRGSLDLTWFGHLNNRAGEHLLQYWKWLFRTPQKERPYELHSLVEALVTSQRQAWEAHLFEVAQAELARRPREEQDGQMRRLRLYSLHEIQEVSTAMGSPLPTPLSTILERKEGTMRFGHALRQLREQAFSMAREILEDLESVRTRDQLMDALTRARETCEVMDAKSPFLIIPSDRDLQLLLEDVERYGAHTIASLLRLLSTLHRAPRREEVFHREDAQTQAESRVAGASDAPASIVWARTSGRLLKGKKICFNLRRSPCMSSQSSFA
jgi:hypothetical protein